MKTLLNDITFKVTSNFFSSNFYTEIFKLHHKLFKITLASQTLGFEFVI